MSESTDKSAEIPQEDQNQTKDGLETNSPGAEEITIKQSIGANATPQEQPVQSVEENEAAQPVQDEQEPTIEMGEATVAIPIAAETIQVPAMPAPEEDLVASAATTSAQASSSGAASMAAQAPAPAPAQVASQAQP